MNLKLKLQRNIAVNSRKAIENFQQNIPLSSKVYTPNSSNFDIERVKFREFLNTIKEDHTRAGIEFKEELKSMHALSYVNEIVRKPEPRVYKKEDYYNRADEINQKFEIQKVEPSKNTVRAGLLGFKVGMTMAWDKFGTAFPLTVVKVDNCQVTDHKTVEKNAYNAVQVGMGDIDPNKLSKAEIGHLIKNNIPPKRFLREFRVTPENMLPIGYMITVRHFIPGQKIDVIGINKGKGFQGVMKRWNFKGQFATHGNSLKHRGAGSIGNREKPGKVWKGKKMAGQLGNESCTMLNLTVFRIDYSRNLIYIKGSIPGNKKSMVLLRDAVKRRFEQFKLLQCPTFVPEEGKSYPAISEWEGTEDLNEKYTHDNDEVLGVSEEEEEGEPEKTADDDIVAKR